MLLPSATASRCWHAALALPIGFQPMGPIVQQPNPQHKCCQENDNQHKNPPQPCHKLFSVLRLEIKDVGAEYALISSCISWIMDMTVRFKKKCRCRLRTATSVPGRKIKVIKGIVFTVRLSCRASAAICREDSATMMFTLLSLCDIRLYSCR